MQCTRPGASLDLPPCFVCCGDPVTEALISLSDVVCCGDPVMTEALIALCCGDPVTEALISLSDVVASCSTARYPPPPGFRHRHHGRWRFFHRQRSVRPSGRAQPPPDAAACGGRCGMQVHGAGGAARSAKQGSAQRSITVAVHVIIWEEEGGGPTNAQPRSATGWALAGGAGPATKGGALLYVRLCIVSH